MGSKRLNFDEFFDQSITVKTRQTARQANGGQGVTLATKATADCSVHRLDGSKTGLGDDSLGGKLAMSATHAFVTAEALDLANGDIAEDADGRQYTITYWERVSAYYGGYFAFYGAEIR